MYGSNEVLSTMGPLQDSVTWYRINYVGMQLTQWGLQNKVVNNKFQSNSYTPPKMEVNSN